MLVFSTGKSKLVLFGLTQRWSGVGVVHPVESQPRSGLIEPQTRRSREPGRFPGGWVVAALLWRMKLP